MRLCVVRDAAVADRQHGASVVDGDRWCAAERALVCRLQRARIDDRRDGVRICTTQKQRAGLRFRQAHAAGNDSGDRQVVWRRRAVIDGESARRRTERKIAAERCTQWIATICVGDIAAERQRACARSEQRSACRSRSAKCERADGRAVTREIEHGGRICAGAAHCHVAAAGQGAARIGDEDAPIHRGRARVVVRRIGERQHSEAGLGDSTAGAAQETAEFSINDCRTIVHLHGARRIAEVERVEHFDGVRRRDIAEDERLPVESRVRRAPSDRRQCTADVHRAIRPVGRPAASGSEIRRCHVTGNAQISRVIFKPQTEHATAESECARSTGNTDAAGQCICVGEFEHAGVECRHTSVGVDGVEYRGACARLADGTVARDAAVGVCDAEWLAKGERARVDGDGPTEGVRTGECQRGSSILNEAAAGVRNSRDGVQRSRSATAARAETTSERSGDAADVADAGIRHDKSCHRATGDIGVSGGALSFKSQSR